MEVSEASRCYPHRKDWDFLPLHLGTLSLRAGGFGENIGQVDENSDTSRAPPTRVGSRRVATLHRAPPRAPDASCRALDFRRDDVPRDAAARGQG